MVELSLKNLWKLIKKRSLVLIIIVVSQFAAILSIFFIYGIYMSYNYAKEEIKISSLQIFSHFENDTPPTMKEVKSCLEPILDKVEERLDYFYIMGGYDGVVMGIHTEYHDGIYTYSSTVRPNTEASIEDGRLMTDEEIKSGARVVFGRNVGEVGDTLNFAGVEYQVVGVFEGMKDDSKAIWIPYTSCSDNAKVRCIALMFKTLPRHSDYKAFCDGLKKAFGDKVLVDDFEIKDMEKLISYNSIILFSVIISLLVALDTALLHSYLIYRRRGHMKVYALTGATRWKLFMINELEPAIVSIITAVLGLLFFRFAIEEKVVGLYEVESQVYTGKIYGLFLGIYLGVVLVVTAVTTLRYSAPNIMKMIREE